VHTEAQLSGSLDEIDYDPTSPSVRIRFSIAHELGHRVLHPQQIKALRPSSYAEWKNTINYLPNAMWGRAEWQAREFAGRLLVPRELLIQEARKYQNEIEKAGKQIPDVTTDDITEFLAPRICNKFDVSDTVIKTRLCHEEIDLLNF
jgi:Zn-dependent peptidase ImmA (M78 family)